MSFPKINTWIDWLLFGYNIVAGNGTSMPKQGAINFLSPFTVTDNPTNNSTDIEIDGSQLGFELSPADLTMHEVSSGTLPGFQPASMVTLDEEFTNSSLTRFTIFPITGATAITPTISGGQMVLANTSGQGTIIQEGAAMTVPNIAVSCLVASFTTTSGNSFENFGVGVGVDGSNYLMATWERISGRVTINANKAGSSSDNAPFTIALTPPFSLGMSIVANNVTAWVKQSGGAWTAVTNFDISSIFNFKTMSLTTWKSQLIFDSASTHPCTLSVQSLKIGSFGGVAIRDICPLTSTDGTPIMNGSVATVTATLADPADANYCGILTYDVINKVLTQTGVVFVNRSSALQNDTASHLIQDGTGGYYFFITTWGNFGSGASAINILYKHETTLNLSSGVNAVASMAQLTLPGIPSGGGSYDPFAVLNGSTWNLAFTVGPSSSDQYYPALASSANLSTWSSVGADTASILFEGTRISKIGGSYTVLASTVVKSAGAGVHGAAGTPYVRTYDLSMNWTGNIYVPGFLEASDNEFPPHCSLVPFGNYVYWLTFDNTEVSSVPQGHFRVFRALRYGPSVD